LIVVTDAFIALTQILAFRNFNLVDGVSELRLHEDRGTLTDRRDVALWVDLLEFCVIYVVFAVAFLVDGGHDFANLEADTAHFYQISFTQSVAE
jgi:hypothetical protein